MHGAVENAKNCNLAVVIRRGSIELQLEIGIRIGIEIENEKLQF
jgi:hypothetical protein